jgi:hypothetical protein
MTLTLRNSGVGMQRRKTNSDAVGLAGNTRKENQKQIQKDFCLTPAEQLNRIGTLAEVQGPQHT